MALKKFPIGIQTFEKIRTNGFYYVDKTDLVYKMTHESDVYFLSRPRRFGKSLLVTTLQSYFEGRNDLFEGLAIAELETEWKKYPVLHFDFSLAKNKDIETIKSVIDDQLTEYERIYGRRTEESVPSVRFKNLIYAAEEQTSQKVVILIDEYDAPLLDTLVDDATFNTMRNIMRDFFSPLKACDAHLKFVFLTGITKFSQLSIFSELNNLKNISMVDEYASICGITEHEMLTQMQPEIQALADKQELTYDGAVAALKQMYDGYHFSEESPDVYNPFSLINALSDRTIKNYWFSTGTPTVLTQLVNKYEMNPAMFDEGFEASEEMFNVPTETATDAVPMLYQSGYLTIKDYTRKGNLYKLQFPNEEIRMGFLKSLMPYYATKIVSRNEIFLINLSKLMEQGKLEDSLQLMKSFFSSIPYNAESQNENHYKTIFYLIFRLITPFVTGTEVCSAAGRADAVVETDNAVIVFEFKLDGSAEAALKQIDEKGYLLPFAVTKKADGSPKALYKIGANFDIKTRTLGKWIIREG